MVGLFRLNLTSWVLFLACVAALSQPALGQGLDPHQIYERNCSGCHVPHAGDFARTTLSVKGGQLVGERSGRDVEAFLGGGHGRVSQAEAAVLVEQFRNILRTGGIFDRKCRICHDRAVVVARSKLIKCEGKVRGRYSGRDMSDFLTYHGRLEPAEIEKILAMFARQLEPGACN